jgi:hypothetical protein
MHPALKADTDTTCDICGADYDTTTTVDVNSTNTCPCCSGADRRSHGFDLRIFRKRK